MQDILRQAMEENFDKDASVLAKAARVVRNDIFKARGFRFDGYFPGDCQQTSVPTNLKMLVSMLLYGASLKDQQSKDSQACLTISQAIFLNCRKNPKCVEGSASERT